MKVPQSAFLEAGAIPVIDQGQSFIAGYTDDEGSQFRSAQLPVVVFGDHTKAVKFIDFPFAMGADGVKVLKPGDGCDTKYLYHFLRYAKLPDAGYSRHFKFVKELKIPLLPLAEQRRIAAILDTADALRAKRREAIAKIDQLLQSVFLDMFGDHFSERRSWPVMSLGKALSQAEVFTDGDWVESKDQDPNGDVRLIQLADVGDGAYVDKSRRFLTREKALELRCTFLQQNDILVARMPDPLGRACIFPGDSRESVTVVDVCVIRPSETGPNRRWLCACLNSDAVRSQIARMATGTTRSRVSRGNLSKVELALPPVALQEHFDQIAEAIERQKRFLQHGAAQLDTLFASLQHRAFSGTL